MVDKCGGQSLKATSPEQHMIDKEMVAKDMCPEELRVLAVDDDPVTLRVIEAQLRHCHYKVTKTTEATTALKLLREDKNAFDLVITDVVHLHDMDGFKLLEIIGLEMDLPVIMMSVDDNPSKVRKGIEHGACDYLVKPIRLEEIRNIWKHVVRKSKFSKSDLKVENVAGDLNMMQKKRNSNQLNENETNIDDQHSATKKPRFRWSPYLHQKFVDAYDKLGPDKAIPSKILKELKDVPKITRDIVASHLQKYRIGLKRTISQKSNITVASSQMSGQQLSVADLSDDKEGQIGTKSFTGTNVYSSSQFGHHIQNREAFSHSFVTPTSHLCHLNQQNILALQCPPNIVDEYRQRIQLHEVSDISSNSIMMGNVHHQKYLNGLNSVSFSSRSRICNAYTDMPSKMPDYTASSYQLLGCTSNSLPIHSSTDFAGFPMHDAIARMLSTVVQNDCGMTAGPNFLPGQNEERYMVHTRMETSNMEQSIRTDQKPLVQHPFELGETDSTNQLSRCSSTDDDLTAAVKQFQQ